MQNVIEVLLVEDSLYDAELTVRALKKKLPSINIAHVTDGDKALDALLGNGNDTVVRPRIILLDLKMPKTGGIEVLRTIKEKETTKDIPVVVLTSSVQDPDIKACQELGANSYIIKPVGYDNFMETVSKLGLYWPFIDAHT